MANNKTTHFVIIGFGPQAQAWSSNLKEKGVSLSIAARPGHSYDLAKAQGFEVHHLDDQALGQFKNFIVLASDQQHQNILQNLQDHVPQGAAFIYAHGQSVTNGQFFERFGQWDHFLLAPKAIASEVRQAGRGQGKLAAVMSLEVCKYRPQEKARELLLDLAKNLGVSAGPYQVTFKEETMADLFSEQSLLCSLLPYAARKSFENLRAKGIGPELAYLECWHEVNLISRAMLQAGPAGLFKLISSTALIGGQKALPLFFDKNFDDKLKQIEGAIWEGDFFKNLNQLNDEEIKAIRQKTVSDWQEHELTKIHQQLFGDLYQ